MAEFLDPRECPHCGARLPRQATKCLECNHAVDEAVTNPNKVAQEAEERKAARAKPADKPDKPKE